MAGRQRRGVLQRKQAGSDKVAGQGENSMKKVILMTIRRTEQLADGIYRTVLHAPEGDGFGTMMPGQFLGIYPNDPAALLPRPISLCRQDPGTGDLVIVYRTAGRGTLELATQSAGSTVRVLGALGNGYDLSRFRGKRVLLLGGGIGIPPMLELAARLAGESGTAKQVTAVLGYRSSDFFLLEEFRKTADRVLIATDDGSAGTHGTVLDAVREDGTAFDIVAACGPMPMLRGVKQFAEERGTEAFLSLEERMACGVGVCLGCVCRTVNRDDHSKVNNARVCTEGPVFLASEVDI